jgi:outer membrane protein OmpA-like peptidoglycan-associated protein
MAATHSSSDLASSLTDLMTSLAVIFVLLLVASLNNTQRKTDKIRNNILITLRQQLQAYAVSGVQVLQDSKDPLGLLVLVPEGLLQFQKDKDVIPPQGFEFLDKFSPKLASTACSPQFRDEINSIVIEGHADSSGDEEKINLPLSQRRAMAVVTGSLQALKKNEPPEQSDGLRSCFLKFVSASGRGSEELVLTNGKEDPEKSRRVIFKIRVRSVEQRKVVTLLGG